MLKRLMTAFMIALMMSGSAAVIGASSGAEAGLYPGKRSSWCIELFGYRICLGTGCPVGYLCIAND